MSKKKLSLQQAIIKAKVAYEKGEFDLASKIFSAVLKKHPKNKVAKGFLQKIEQNTFKSPSEKLESSTRSNQTLGSIQNKINTLIDLCRSGQMIKAENACKKILETHQGLLLVHYLLGISQSGQGKLKEAIQAFNKAIEIDSNYSAAYFDRGNAFDKLGQIDKALGDFNKAIRIKSDFTDAYNNRGLVLRRLGRLAEALKDFDIAIELNPSFAQAHYNRGLVLQSMQQMAKAIKAYEKTIQLEEGFVDAYSNLGSAHKELGQLHQAMECFETAIQLKPDNAAAHNNHAAVLKAQGQLEKAVVSCSRAIQLKPDYAEAYSNRGLALQGLNQFEKALLDLNKAIQLKPHYEAFYNRGGLLEKLERWDEAIRDFDQCNEPRARARALEILYKLGRYQPFLERLHTLNKFDHVDRRIAAISAFAADQLKLDNPHRFCKKPLDYLSINQLNELSESFVASLLEELRDRKAQWEPEGKTTHFGFQTEATLFINPTETIQRLERIIFKEIESYHSRFRSKDCLFIDLWPKKFNLHGWFVRLLDQGYQGSHMHPSGWLSGVVYLQVPEFLEGDEGTIKFGLQGFDYPIVREPLGEITHRPKPGDIALFPSSLFHKTVPFVGKSERMVVAFDLLPDNSK